MPLVNMAKHKITCRILYYGIACCGRMTNLHYIHHAVNPPVGEERASLDTQTKPPYIDLVTLELPDNVHGYTLRFHLERWSDYYLDPRVHTSTLKRADGVIFVVDSQASKLQENIACWNELQERLRCAEKEPADVVHVMQWNKRDLPDVLPVSVLEEALNPYQVPK